MPNAVSRRCLSTRHERERAGLARNQRDLSQGGCMPGLQVGDPPIHVASQVRNSWLLLRLSKTDGLWT
jgi:hypothetical protein